MWFRWFLKFCTTLSKNLHVVSLEGGPRPSAVWGCASKRWNEHSCKMFEWVWVMSQEPLGQSWAWTFRNAKVYDMVAAIELWKVTVEKLKIHATTNPLNYSPSSTIWVLPLSGAENVFLKNSGCSWPWHKLGLIQPSTHCVITFDSYLAT